MSFLNPLFFLGALAVAGPLLVHLFRREESRKQVFSSLMFVRHLPKPSWRRRRFRHVLLLATRVLALLLLVLAFARPYFKSQSVPGLQSKAKSVVILLDNSLSMREGGRMEAAKKEASALLSGLGTGDRVHLATFSDSVQVLSQYVNDKSSLGAVLADVRPGYRKTDYRAALRMANQLLASMPNTTQEVHLISDFQKSGWENDTSPVALGEKVKLVPHAVGAREAGNIYVNQVRVLEQRDGRSRQATVTAKLNSAGLPPANGNARLQLNGKDIQTKPFSLAENGTTVVAFAPFPAPPGVSEGTVVLDLKDALADDNRAHFVLTQEEQSRVLLVSSGGGAGADDRNFYLMKALRAGSLAPFSVETRDVRAPDEDLSSYQAVVLNDSAVPKKLADRLVRFVKEGGGLVLVAGPRTDGRRLSDGLQEILPGTLGAAQVRKDGRQVFPASVERQHAVFQLFQPVHQSYFLTTPFHGFVDVNPAPNGIVLMQLEGKKPLLLERTVGKGRALLFASSMDMEWNDLPLRSVFVPFVQELMKYAMRLDVDTDGPRVGDHIPVGKLNPNLKRALRSLNNTLAGSFRQAWQVRSPSGEGIELDEKNLTESDLFTLEEPGFYETEVKNLKYPLAVNLPQGESDLSGMEPARFEEMVQRTTDHRTTPDSDGGTPEERRTWESSQRVWWYLIIAATCLLLLESWLANRTTTARSAA